MSRRTPPPGSPYTEHVGDHGFRYIDEAAADIPDYVNLGHCRVHNFPLKDITVAGQEYLHPEKIREYTDHPPREKGRPPKVILRPYGDDDIAVADGHHSIAAARARGETHIRAKWMEDDPTEDAYGQRHWNAREASLLRPAAAGPGAALPALTASGPVTARERAMPLVTRPSTASRKVRHLRHRVIVPGEPRDASQMDCVTGTSPHRHQQVSEELPP